MPSKASKAKKKATGPSPIQCFILDELTRRGMKRYTLAKQCGISPRHIYEVLRRPTRHTNIERMLAALEIELVTGYGRGRRTFRFTPTD